MLHLIAIHVNFDFNRNRCFYEVEMHILSTGFPLFRGHWIQQKNDLCREIARDYRIFIASIAA